MGAERGGMRMLPPVTLAILILCGAIWAYLNFGANPGRTRVGIALAPSTFSIWNGSYWGLLTTAFVHLEIWHILFNMLWAKDFGRLLEPRFGSAKFVGFVVCAAVVSSGWQLAFSNQTGIGFSGVVYAFFGYMLAARDRDPMFSLFLNRNTIFWMVGWLILCVILTFTGTWNVGNGAHIAGLIFGFLAGVSGSSNRFAVFARVGVAIVIAGALMSAVYMPWSEAWRFRDMLHQFEQE
jgi:membrane associated rhomboid family serine protease